MFGSNLIARRALAPLATAALILSVVGCGDSSGLGKRYPVSGSVTYKGQPVAKGNISFYSTGAGAESRSAFGEIKDGKYSISTQDEGDGAFPGDYLVSITSREVDSSTTDANAKQSGSGRQDDVAKAYASAKSLIPKKYEVPEQSGLKAKVEAKSNTIDFPLAD
ncbi:MAG: hypothetical protein U0835_18650 [Isosphaeraceae bacterium]